MAGIPIFVLKLRLYSQFILPTEKLKLSTLKSMGLPDISLMLSTKPLILLAVASNANVRVITSDILSELLDGKLGRVKRA